jgi:hypothetical protein
MSPLFESVRSWVLRNLPHDKSDPQLVAALAAKEPAELLVWYLNWSSRFPSPTQRRVFTSLEFQRTASGAPFQTELVQIFNDIEMGRKLDRYLSKRVLVGFELPKKSGPKKLNQLEHLDLLLNDWGIHHLHISTKLEPDGFVVRVQPLILAIFKPGSAYLIDIVKHDDWSNDRLIRIIVENWPAAGLVHEIKGIIGTEARQFTPAERLKLRSVGIATTVQIDGRTFSPALGISTAGTSVQTSRTAMHIMRALKSFEEQHLASTSIQYVSPAYGAIPASALQYRFARLDAGYGVRDISTGIEQLLVSV